MAKSLSSALMAEGLRALNPGDLCPSRRYYDVLASPTGPRSALLNTQTTPSKKFSSVLTKLLCRFNMLAYAKMCFLQPLSYAFGFRVVSSANYTRGSALRLNQIDHSRLCGHQHLPSCSSSFTCELQLENIIRLCVSKMSLSTIPLPLHLRISDTISQTDVAPGRVGLLNDVVGLLTHRRS